MNNNQSDQLPDEKMAIELVRQCLEAALQNPTPQHIDAVNRALKTVQLLRELQPEAESVQISEEVMKKIEQELLGL